jgi:TolB-like protein/tetratricopeptide (TPR) repeat protein
MEQILDRRIGGYAETGPVLALLPFATPGGGEAEGLVAQGLLEDISAELTRFPLLQIVSWMSGLAVADLPDAEAGARLGASHVLRGGLRRQGERLRITATLVETAGARQVWSDAFDAPVEGVFEVQNEIVARTAASLTARIEGRALANARRKPVESLAAWEGTLRGLQLLREGTLAADEEARGYFERAIAIDPHYARAHAGLSLSHFNEWSCQHWDLFEGNGAKAYAHAHAALALDDRDPMVHVVIGRVLLYRRQFDQAAWYLDRALALCPNDADVLMELALCDIYLGQPELALEKTKKAMRLNPFHPDHYYPLAALAHFYLRDFETALSVAGRTTAVPFVDLPAYMAMALAFTGRKDKARAKLAEYEALYIERIRFGRPSAPGDSARWLLDVNPYRRETDEALLVEGFALLGAASAPRTDPVPFSTPDRSLLTREGTGWVIEFAGGRSYASDMKGLRDIRRLLERPGEEVHCLDLADRGEESFGGDAALDAPARAALKARIRDLQEELAEAEDRNDIGRADRLRGEMDQLVDALAGALGLGGRSRRLGSLAERARSSVTWRIRHAVRKLAAANPALGRHLENSLRTGAFCAYVPEQPVAWRFVP